MDEEREDVLFHTPVPPPFPPPPGARVLFMRRDEDDAEPTREHEDMMLRRVPRQTAMRFRAAAGGRGMTYAQYLAALVALHEAMRAAAEGGDDRVAAELDRLGLETVTV